MVQKRSTDIISGRRWGQIGSLGKSAVTFLLINVCSLGDDTFTTVALLRQRLCSRICRGQQLFQLWVVSAAAGTAVELVDDVVHIAETVASKVNL